jgi:hypothetical protein
MVKEKGPLIIESIYRKPIGNTTGKSQYLVVSWPSPPAGTAGGNGAFSLFSRLLFFRGLVYGGSCRGWAVSGSRARPAAFTDVGGMSFSI